MSLLEPQVFLWDYQINNRLSASVLKTKSMTKYIIRLKILAQEVAQ